MNATTIGIDIAKSVFQVHGVDAAGQVTVTKKLRRAEVMKFFEATPPCLVGMEACATAHFWAREISALGHDVRLMPPSYVKAYLRRQKNDAAGWPGPGDARRAAGAQAHGSRRREYRAARPVSAERIGPDLEARRLLPA